MTEAEQIANELAGGYLEPTWLESKAAALLRSQAAEIERLREILARALAQMRTQRRIDRAEFPSESEDEIKTELGERV